MTLFPTLLTLAAAVALFLLARHFHEKPYEPGRLWRPPWLAIMFLTAFLAIGMLAHLVTLLTGKPFTGRSGF